MNRHEVNSCCYYFVCAFGNSRNFIKTFVGQYCVTEMIKELKTLAWTCIDEMQINDNMILKGNEKVNFENAKTCCLCDEPFGDSKALQKVRDHDHRTGCYRGACHNKCNINYFCNRCVIFMK